MNRCLLQLFLLTAFMQVGLANLTFSEKKYYKSCEEIQNEQPREKHGVYHIYPNHLAMVMEVYCEGKWMVIQRRFNGSQDFARSWNQYKLGFGDLSGEFWFGNEKLSGLTSTSRMQIRFDLWDANNRHKYAVYSHFSVAPESEKYKLTIGGYQGTSGDAMISHNGYKFSTKDSDNDIFSGSCSVDHGGSGGWWFNYCIDSNLNGKYLPPGTPGSNGITWDTWQNQISLKKSKISIAFV